MIYYICLSTEDTKSLKPNMSKREFFTKYISKNPLKKHIILKQQNNVRIKILDSSTFQELKKSKNHDYFQVNSVEYVFGVESANMERYPGVLLATLGSQSNKCDADELNYDFVRKLNSVY